MSDFDYDLIVIGAGSGGTRTARISASYGAKTLVIEGDRAGGTCVLRGCVPKKLLVKRLLFFFIIFAKPNSRCFDCLTLPPLSLDNI